MSVTTVNQAITISIHATDVEVDIQTKLESKVTNKFNEYSIIPVKKRYIIDTIKIEKIEVQSNKKAKSMKRANSVNSAATKAIEHEEIKKEYDKAVKYDKLRATAKNIKQREEYKTLALDGYRKIVSRPGKSSTYFAESYFRSAYLADLNEKGEFAPQNKTRSYDLYTQAAKLDEKNCVIRNISGLLYSVTNKGAVEPRFFEKAERLQSKLAGKIAELSPNKQKAKVAYYCKNPDKLYFETR